MHAVASDHIFIVGIDQVLLNQLDCTDCRCIGEITVNCGYKSFNRMGQRIHSGMSYQLLRHGLCQLRIHDCNVRGNLKVGDWIFNSLFVVCDDGECGNFCSCSGCGRNRTEFCLGAQLWQSEYHAHILKGYFRIFVLNPHCFRRIDWRTATDCYNPIRAKVLHKCRTLHYGLNGWIRLDSFKYTNFHSGLFQITLCFVQETEALHGAAAHTDNRFLSFKLFQHFQCTFAMINVSWVSKSLHFIFLL